jgi:hypothetical protein
MAHLMARSSLSTKAIAFPSPSGVGSGRPQIHPARDELPDTISLLCIPNGSEYSTIPKGARQIGANGEAPDVVVLTEANSAGLIANHLSPSVAAIVPVIDASGELHLWGHGRADLRISANAFSLKEALSILKPVIDRVRALAEPVLTAADPRMILLARLAVRGRDMEPARDPSFRETVSYPDATAVPDALALAEELVCLGLLERKFFDKLITCPRCDSARLSVREHCGACQSTDLVEETLVHHLRCSTQGPEGDFRQGTSLVCPKCRLHLEHFSVDYDRPGNVMLCRSCGHISTDAGVGFMCLDCEQAGNTDETGTRTVWRYQVSEAGLAHVKCGAPVPKSVHDPVLARLEAFVSRQRAAERQFCVLACRLTQPEGINKRLWEQTCALFGRLLQEMFAAETEVVDAIVEATPLFFALLAGDCKSEVERAVPQIRRDLERHLEARPCVDYAVFGPDEMARILRTST